MNRNKTIDQWLIILIQVLVPIAMGCLSIKLGQDTSWDVQNYHLYNPYALLNGRLNTDLLPCGAETFYNPYLDLAYFMGTKYAAPWAVGFVIGFLQGLNFIVLFHICKVCLKAINAKYAGRAMILAFWGILSVGFISEVGTVFWDNLVSLFELTSLLIILASIGPMVSGKRSALFPVVFAGIIAGMGGGFKLTVILNALALFFSFFIISMPWKRKLSFAAFFGGGMVLGFLMIDGTWLWKVWQLMGNPIFPRMNHIFHGALAPFTPILDERFLPKDILEKIFYPVIFTLDPLRVAEVYFWQISWLMVFWVSIFSLFRKKTDQMAPEIKYLLSFFGISFLLWLNIFGIYRYLITIEILIPLVLFVLILSIFAQYRLAPLIVVAMLGLVTMYNLYGVPDWGRSNWGPQVYRIETTWAQKEKIDSAVLIGLPLSWIIPALDIKAPFIQLMPNFPADTVNKAYFQRAKAMIKNSQDGKILVIFQPWVILPDNAEALLKRYDLGIKEKSCTIEKGYIGTREIFFLFCSAQKANGQ